MKTENDLKSLMLEKLACDFVFKSEVRGVNLVEKKQVIIDFLAKPRPHIIDNGFMDKWFGIEVKYIPEDHSEQKIRQALWQSVTYAQSVYDDIRPPFVFLFTNKIANTAEIGGMLKLCQYANVGSLYLSEDLRRYKFGFGSAQHYYAINNEGHHKGKTNAGQVRYAGNISGVKCKNRNKAR